MHRWVLAISACLIVSCAIAPPAFDEKQITSHIGTASSPVLSRQASVIAFSAAAYGHSNPQIWVARADGSAPPRPLTSDLSNNYDPEFSPDGRSIYFTSTREPQGIYRISSSGGTPELVIANGVRAKFSPDGNTILYGSGGKIVRRSSAGGSESLLVPSIENSYAPIWSPDGKQILITTSTSDKREPEWWIVPAEAGEPRKTNLGTDLRLRGFNYIATDAWLPGDWIVFTGRQGETQTLWKIQLGRGGNTVGNAIRATNDAEGDYGASFTAGKLVFSRSQVGMNFWALTLDASGEHALGIPEPLTSGPARKGYQSMVGPKLLYSAEDGNRFSLFLKDRQKGHEQKLRDGFFSVLDPDGSQYVYGEGTREQLHVYIRSLRWWPFWSSTVCDNCGMPRQFSPDGKKLLLWADSALVQHIDMIDLQTHTVDRIASAPFALAGPVFSPDGRWISFVANIGKNQWQAFVAPASQGMQPGSSTWRPVTAVSNFFQFVFWSAHDDLVYTLSSHDQGGNLRFLDAQRLNQTTKLPVGAAASVYEFDEKLVPGMDSVWNKVTVDANRIILELGDISTEIWMK